MIISLSVTHTVKMGNYEMVRVTAGADGDTSLGVTEAALNEQVRSTLHPVLEKIAFTTACGPDSPEGDSYIHEWLNSEENH